MLPNLAIAATIFLLAYLCGSLPTGYLAGLARGIDIREHGSGSTGATNVLRTLGKIPGAIVLAIDALKGILAVTLARNLPLVVPTFPAEWLAYLIPLAATGAILGHSKSIWLKFGGGKSVATGVGVLLAMSWQVGLATLAVFGITIAITRIVSVSSISAALSVTIWMSLFAKPLPWVVFALSGGLYVTWLHRQNIERLRSGTEPKLGRKLDGT